MTIHAFPRYPETQPYAAALHRRRARADALDGAKAIARTVIGCALGYALGVVTWILVS